MRKSTFAFLALLALSAVGCAETHHGQTVLAANTAAQLSPGPKVLGDASSTLVPAGREFALTLRIAIDAKDLPRPPRPALNVSLCIDTSGSMEGKPIEDARKAALAFVDALRPGDYVSVVTFDSKARLLVPAQLVDESNRAEMRKSVATMKAEGTTGMAQGLQISMQQVQQHYDATRVNRVVLLGDGVPNDEAPVRALAQNAVSSQIAITTLGLGADYDELLMGAIARTSNGRFHHIDDSNALAGFFADELTRIQRSVARNSRIDLVAGPGITIDGVVGFPNAGRSGNTVILPIGDIALGDRRELFVKIHGGAHRDGAPVELVDATLHYDTDGVMREEHVFVGSHASADDAKVQGAKDALVEQGASKAQAAWDELEAIRRAKETDKPKVAPNLPPKGAGGKPVGTIVQPAPAAVDAEDLKLRHDRAMRTLMGD
jgi:Ca-activated chloride channel family protein